MAGVPVIRGTTLLMPPVSVAEGLPDMLPNGVEDPAVEEVLKFGGDAMEEIDAEPVDPDTEDVADKSELAKEATTDDRAEASELAELEAEDGSVEGVLEELIAGPTRA